MLFRSEGTTLVPCRGALTRAFPTPLKGPRRSGVIAETGGLQVRTAEFCEGAPAAESTVTPVVRLEIPWPDLVRRACGRVPADDPGLQARIRLDGDADLGRDLLRGLTITP